MVAQKIIFVAGHNGMVGSALVRMLSQKKNNRIITANRSQLNLTNQTSVDNFFAENKIDEVYLAAAKVGGIYANSEYPADFIYENLMIEANVINAASNSDVHKLLFLGSSCIYPKLAEQPMSEESLLTGKLEPTNEPYAIAKIAGIKLCESYNRQYGRDYRSVMPTNLYGPGDNFHQVNSHVIPALIRRLHEAKESGLSEVVAWGSGAPMREFLHVDDMAAGSIFVMDLDREAYNENTELMLSHVNIGSGIDVTIKELTKAIAKVVGFSGSISWDSSKPDGPEKKLMDVSRLKNLGWRASINMEAGLRDTYQWYLDNIDGARR